VGRVAVEGERDRERRDDERHDGQARDGSPPRELAGRRGEVVPALGSVVDGLGAPAIRPQHGTKPQADPTQQVGVTPQVVLEQWPAERDRGRRDVAPAASGYAHGAIPARF
jgi:hypothetical protein